MDKPYNPSHQLLLVAHVLVSKDFEKLEQLCLNAGIDDYKLGWNKGKIRQNTLLDLCEALIADTSSDAIQGLKCVPQAFIYGATEFGLCGPVDTRAKITRTFNKLLSFIGMDLKRTTVDHKLCLYYLADGLEAYSKKQLYAHFQPNS